MPSPGAVKVQRLPPGRWRGYRALRLEALKTNPEAFGSSYEEEVRYPEERWRERAASVLCAVSSGVPIGMISYVVSERAKTRHVATIYGVYVTPKHRGKGVGKLLVSSALAAFHGQGGVIKVKLDVNPEMRAAVALYKGAGFRVSGREEKELKVGGRYQDLLLMEKFFRADKLGRRTSQ